MPKARKPADLFVPLAPENRLNAHFLKLRSENGSEPARLMMSEIYQSFPDADGNFAEQFQTAGFDARTFELYLYAYLSRSGYQIRRDYPYPDFVVKRAGVSCAIEATTANPSGGLSSGEPFPFGDEPTPQQINEKMNNELQSDLVAHSNQSLTKDTMASRTGSLITAKTPFCYRN